MKLDLLEPGRVHVDGHDSGAEGGGDLYAVYADSADADHDRHVSGLEPAADHGLVRRGHRVGDHR